MEKQSKLPIVVKNNLPQKLKKAGINILKYTGLSIAGLGTAAFFVGSLTFAPVLFPPAVLLSVYTGQKILNNTKYKSYKDLIFVVKNHNGNLKIFQDLIRPSMIIKFSRLNTLEKIGFMQLQAIVGLSKFQTANFNTENPTFETDTHSILQKTFKSLENIGYIKNYSEQFLKQSNLATAKIALGNFKDIKQKTDLYHINFNISDKRVDLNDESLRKAFPLVFSKKHGILKKYGIIQNPNGSLEIDYNNQHKISLNPTKNPNDFMEQHKVNLSLEDQNAMSKSFQQNNQQFQKPDNDKNDNFPIV